MSIFLITGASRGIGKAVAVKACEMGHNVVINYRTNREAAEALAEKLGKNAVAICADVACEQDVKNMFRKAESLFGGIDVLINNAGISSFSLFQDISVSDWDRMFDVNAKGAFLCSREALPHMIRKKNGVIINVSSMWGIVGSSCEVHYSASKAALIGMTKALAKEIGPSGIRVNCVAPGAVDTDMNKVLSQADLTALCEETPLGRIASPEEIADTILYLCSDNASFITGQVISPNGGLVI